ncbi:MAG: DNA polymerase IV [Epsilonproteobacteria bacterium]|nr:DNA polymerase IV [Campylobacterota bacterium]
MKLHLDLDSFFVSAHRVEDKSLLNIPAAVVKRNDTEIFTSKAKVLNLNRGAFTGDLVLSTKKLDKSYYMENGKIRGIVVSASYEARALGIKTGTTLSEALSIYPELAVIVPDYRLYHTLSYRLKIFLKKRVPVIEQYSIDEFFLDVKGWVRDEDVFEFAKSLKEEILSRFSLPVSIGIAHSKWIAKLATTYAKPRGIYKVDDVQEFIKDIPIEKFPGIGRGISRRLKGRGVSRLSDIKAQKELLFSWGKPGVTLYKRVMGEDNEEVKENTSKKSLGISRKFDPVFNREEALRRVYILCRYLAYLINSHRLNPTFFYLKIKYKSSKSSKAHSIHYRLFSEKTLKDIMKKLFISADREYDWIVGLGLRVGKFKSVTNLFNYQEDAKNRCLESALFSLKRRYGVSIVINGVEIKH